LPPRAANVLQILSRMIEGSDIERRVEALEEAVADRQDQPYRPNGGGAHHAARP
jgi:hypothetical protein